MTSPLWGKYCDGGHYCSAPKECCTLGCCYHTLQAEGVLGLWFLGHWSFWALLATALVAAACACSLWRRCWRAVRVGCSSCATATIASIASITVARDERASEPDSVGSCYAPPHYSRCNSFHHAPPPPYAEVTSKPDLYPLVISYNGDTGIKRGGSASYLMVQYFRNYILRPSGSISATSTIDSLSSSFICNAANEANTVIPPPYSCTGSLDGFTFTSNTMSLPVTDSQMLQSVSSTRLNDFSQHSMQTPVSIPVPVPTPHDSPKKPHRAAMTIQTARSPHHSPEICCHTQKTTTSAAKESYSPVTTTTTSTPQKTPQYSVCGCPPDTVQNCTFLGISQRTSPEICCHTAQNAQNMQHAPGYACRKSNAAPKEAFATEVCCHDSQSGQKAPGEIFCQVGYSPGSAPQSASVPTTYTKTVPQFRESPHHSFTKEGFSTECCCQAQKIGGYGSGCACRKTTTAVSLGSNSSNSNISEFCTSPLRGFSQPRHSPKICPQKTAQQNIPTSTCSFPRSFSQEGFPAGNFLPDGCSREAKRIDGAKRSTHPAKPLTERQRTSFESEAEASQGEEQNFPFFEFSDLLNLSLCAPSGSLTPLGGEGYVAPDMAIATSVTVSDISSLANLGTPDSPPRATSPTVEIREILDKIQQLPQQPQKSPTLEERGLGAALKIGGMQGGAVSVAMGNEKSIYPREKPQTPSSQPSDSCQSRGARFFNRGRNRALYMPLDTSAPRQHCTRLSPNGLKLFSCAGKSKGWLSRSAPATPCGSFAPLFPTQRRHGPKSHQGSKSKMEDASALLAAADADAEGDADGDAEASDEGQMRNGDEQL